MQLFLIFYQNYQYVWPNDRSRVKFKKKSKSFNGINFLICFSLTSGERHQVSFQQSPKSRT